MRAAATHPPLVTLVLPDEGAGRAARQILLALAGTLLLTVSAKVQLPMWPVPMTMQTFAVLVIGMAFGARLGAATVVLYLLQGAVGLPVFASGGGMISSGSSLVMRKMSSLSALRPGMIDAVAFSTWRAPARVSRRSLALREPSSGPWQL